MSQQTVSAGDGFRRIPDAEIDAMLGPAHLRPPYWVAFYTRTYELFGETESGYLDYIGPWDQPYHLARWWEHR